MRDKISEEDRAAINEWMKTNQITKCEPFERTSTDDIGYTHGWGKKKKKKVPKEVDSNKK